MSKQSIEDLGDKVCGALETLCNLRLLVQKV